MSESDINVVIECGFKKIIHSINFNPNALKNAKELVEHGRHVKEVKEFCVDGVGQQITALIIRTTQPSLYYDVKLYVSLQNA